MCNTIEGVMNGTQQKVMDEYSFASFSTDAAVHSEVNTSLVSLAKLGLRQRIMDLGCGVGGSTQEIIKHINNLKKTIVYAVDVSVETLKTAKRMLSGNKVQIEYITADAGNIDQHLPEKMDAIIYCNSIHYVPDKQNLFKKLRSLLKKDGILAFNSSFLEESHTGIAQKLYNSWAMRAIKKLRKEYGLMPTKEVVESRRRLSVENYLDLVQQSGLKVTDYKVEDVPFDADSFSKISEFRDWVSGFLPGIPLDIASKVLKQTVYEAYDALKIKTVPRVWLHVVATHA